MEDLANPAPENVLCSPSCELAKCTPIGPHQHLVVGSGRWEKKTEQEQAKEGRRNIQSLRVHSETDIQANRTVLGT